MFWRGLLEGNGLLIAILHPSASLWVNWALAMLASVLFFFYHPHLSEQTGLNERETLNKSRTSSTSSPHPSTAYPTLVQTGQRSGRQVQTGCTQKKDRTTGKVGVGKARWVSEEVSNPLHYPPVPSVPPTPLHFARALLCITEAIEIISLQIDRPRYRDY